MSKAKRKNKRKAGVTAALVKALSCTCVVSLLGCSVAPASQTEPSRTEHAPPERLATEPLPTEPVPTKLIRFAFGGDLAGQNVCRDASLGFPVFRQVLRKRPDFFVALGDMIYADHGCSSPGLYGNLQIPRDTGLATNADDFRAHWDYVREDPAFAELLRNIPYYAVWDDHEVRNDFGPGDVDQGLIAASRSVFGSLYSHGEDVLYYRRSFGEQLELFFLDTRSYRDANARSDLPDNPKSMLGEKQKQWLVDSITDSGATWKVIVSSVPLSIPTGWPAERGRDGWANFDQQTGFERELTDVLVTFANHDVRNLVFVTADVHFATGFRYYPFPNYPDFTFHEFVTGPLNAGLFPNREVDDSLNPERLFFYGPDATQMPYEEALRWFNFGVINIGETGSLHFELVDGYGDTQAQLNLRPR